MVSAIFISLMLACLSGGIAQSIHLHMRHKAMQEYTIFNKVLLDTRTGDISLLIKTFGRDEAVYTIAPTVKRDGIWEDQFNQVRVKS